MSILVYAATMFLGLACLLRWKYLRQSAAHRLERSLRVYLMKRPAGLTLARPHLEAA